MKILSGSKRLDFCREVFYWLLFALMWNKLSDSTFCTLVGAIVAFYLGNRVLQPKFEKSAPEGKQED